MSSAGNSASALSRKSHPPSTTDSGNYKVVLPRLPTGNTVLNSVFLHADLAGRPYRASDFRDALLSVLNATDILGAGQYQMSHLWLVARVNSIAKQKLVDKGELLVKGLKCLVIDPECKNIKMKLLWLPPHLEQRRIVEAPEPYGTVQSITGEMWRCDGMEGWQMTNRDVALTLKDGVSASNLPHLLSIYGHQCLILVPGRPPLCLRCNRVGHIRRQCRTPRRNNCHRYGHPADACVGTYADKLRGNRASEDDTITDHLMDVSEVVDATGETLPETRGQEHIKPSSAEISLSQKPASEDETKTKNQLCHGQNRHQFKIAHPSTNYCCDCSRCPRSLAVDRTYDHLKAMLIRRTTETEQHRWQQRLTLEFGNRKPTYILRHMQALAGHLAPSTDNVLLREPLLQRLPPQVHIILTASSFSMLKSRAELPDKIVDVGFPYEDAIHRPPDPLFHSKAAGDSYARLLEANEELTRRVARLTTEVCAIPTRRLRTSS
ncbi:uncharacterized protein LOC142563499 [Dermacentor variabilis]|uniref:uncharacterized protein LOC142563499 n=1 Tax=Dermacentor variabilis TaxID=34621 RepID=UPI003F5BCF70